MLHCTQCIYRSVARLQEKIEKVRQKNQEEDRKRKIEQEIRRRKEGQNLSQMKNELVIVEVT